MRGLFGTTRSIENPAVPISSNALLSMLNSGGATTATGIMVTEESSLAMSGVWRATTLISSIGGSLPLHVMNMTTHKRVDNLLLADPHPEMTHYDLWKLSYVHRCLWGNSYHEKVKDGAGRIRYLLPIMPWNVKVGRAKPIPENPTGKVFQITLADGEKVTRTPAEILHIPGMMYDGICGLSPVRAAAAAIALALAAEDSASRLFGSGNLLSGILQTEQRLDQEQAETLQQRWRSKFSGTANAHQVAVLDSGAEFQSMTMPSSDAQQLESRDFQITELSRYFGVPPYLMFQTEKSTSWGTGLEQQATGFTVWDLHPQWLAPTEGRITKECLLDPKVEARYKLEGLLRGDTVARAEFYTAQRNNGALSANDIRDLEDMPGIGPEGDMYLQPMNYVPLGTDSAQATEDAADKDRQLQLDLADKAAESAKAAAAAKPAPVAAKPAAGGAKK